ncbi:MAG: hypothetical protein JSU82_14610 [Rhodospirillales bacterium]|nr:MAG: hypothetical protein JSU82_14610 [Rhodospirillales bacterium]
MTVAVGLLAFLVYEAALAWRAGQERGPANHTLLQLQSGQRTVGNLAPVELADPYVAAYVTMRDIYRELYRRTEDGMSRYRARYQSYTAEGAFLDAARLSTPRNLRRSIRQIDDLQDRLKRVESAHPDISDLLLSVRLLDIDRRARAAYAAELRAAHEDLLEAARNAAASERETLRSTRRALETLIAAQGRYRIEDGRLIFDDPEDATRFAELVGSHQR